jgi:hypothetical protein
MSGDPMPRPYSQDLRARVIEAVEAGASRREAAERGTSMKGYQQNVTPQVTFQLSPGLCPFFWKVACSSRPQVNFYRRH